MARTGVVLLHGLRASSSLWRRQIEVLTDLGHPVRSPDFPGHGEWRGQRFTTEAAVAVVEDAPDAPEVEDVVVEDVVVEAEAPVADAPAAPARRAANADEA